MEEKYLNAVEEDEIDLLKIFLTLKDKWYTLLIVTIMGAALAYLITMVALKPQYSSTTKMYVLNTQDQMASTITYSDLQSSTQLTKDYMELVTTQPVLESVISEMKLVDTTWEDLRKKISVSNGTDGRIISITVTDEDPMTAKKMADAVRESVASRILSVMAVQAVNVAAEANVPTEKTSPNTKMNIIIGAALFFLLAVGFYTARVVMDDLVNAGEDVERLLGLSILATIPLENSGRQKSMKKKSSKKSHSSSGKR